MTAITLPVGTKTNLTTTALNSLASATYVSAGAIDASSADPQDIIIEVEATPGTVSGNKRLKVFLQESLDNSAFSTGPVSGTTVTDEPVLYPIGVLPLAVNATLQRKAFSVAAALGWVPPYANIIVQNDSGAALAASGNAVNYAFVTGLST